MKRSKVITGISQKSNGFYLTVFFVLFSLAIIVSLIFKGIQLYQQSEFTGKSIMVLVVMPQDSYIMRLDQQSQQLSVLRIYDTQIDTDSLSAASIRTGVPLHGAMIVHDDEVGGIGSVMTTGGMLELLFGNDITLLQLNEYDAIKFANASQRIPQDRRVVKEIENYVYDRSIISQIDHELYELFRDPEVINERTSIEVVNASDISGIATAVAHMLENGGYNVVAIRSADKQKSEIQTNTPDTVAAHNVKKIFSFPVVSAGKNAVADIRIVIGDDAIQ